MRYLIRFFRVVPPVPSLMRGTFVVITGVSVVAVLVDASRATDTLKAVLVLQLFAVSSGFMTHARRGHYDLLLTRADDRAAIALVQWAVAMAPGVAGWATITAAEAIVTSGRVATGLTPGSLAALLVVSTTPWACNTPLPRFAAAIGCLAIFMLGAAIGWPSSVPLPIANVVYPLGMIGRDLRFDGAWLPVGVALTSMCAALAWIRHVSIRLEAAQ